jgi:L-threonylcarbamoyladenylate synthase
MSLTSADAERLQALLEGDGIAVLPTDTVYGVACNPQSAAAIARIYELKQRPPHKPAALMFFSLQAALAALTELGPRTRKALMSLLPGPVTLLLPDGDAGTLGLRVPRLTGLLSALGSVDAPALQSSANFSGQPAPRRLADVPASLREGADLVLDGGDLPGRASTVLDLSGYERSATWRVVREGPLAQSELEGLLG